jgi:hypothetical protein
VRQTSIQLANVELRPLQKARNSLARRGCVGSAHRGLDRHPCGFVRYSGCGGESLSEDTPGACTPRLAVRKPSLSLPGWPCQLIRTPGAVTDHAAPRSTWSLAIGSERSALASREVARARLKAHTLRQSQHNVSVRSPVDVIVQLIRRSGQLASRTVIGYQVGKGTARHTREHRHVVLRSKRPSWPRRLSYSGNSFVISSAYAVAQRRAPEARYRRACSGSTARGRGNDDQQCDA